MTDLLGLGRAIAAVRSFASAVVARVEKRRHLFALSVAVGKVTKRARLAGRLLVRFILRRVETVAAVAKAIKQGAREAAEWALGRFMESEKHAKGMAPEEEKKPLPTLDGPMDPEGLPLADRIARRIRDGASQDAIPVAIQQSEAILETEIARHVHRGEVEAGEEANREPLTPTKGDSGSPESHSPIGFRYHANHDDSVRRGRPEDKGENHLAMDGISAPADDMVWSSFTPPLGFGCRCSLEPQWGGHWTPDALAVAHLRGAAAAPGFGGK